MSGVDHVRLSCVIVSSARGRRRRRVADLLLDGGELFLFRERRAGVGSWKRVIASVIGWWPVV